MRRVGMVAGLLGLASVCGLTAEDREPVQVKNSIGMELVQIPAGQFTMGAPLEQAGADPDETPRTVTIGRMFYLGAHEVTQEQYERVMGDNPGYFRENVTKRDQSGRNPVENVTWEAAVEFCRRLSELPEEKSAGRAYRLPTEAEWEYACRAGTNSAYSFGDSAERLVDHAWFDTNAETQTQPVGSRKPNAWGLYDMHGNVWEWCADWYGPYSPGDTENPRGPSEGTLRVLRGGGWYDEASECRSADRRWSDPTVGSDCDGFRVVLVAAEG